jgi:hypothetical protein
MGKSRSTRGQASNTTAAETAAGPAEGLEQVGRRAMLRRAAGLAAAGIGGIAATEMLTAGPASAAAGDPLTLGQTNDAGNAKTSVNSGAPSATFTISHDNNIANLRLVPVEDSVAYGDPVTGNGDANNTMLGGELINLTEHVDDGTANGQDIDTLFWMAGDNSAGHLDNLAVVLTTATGTVFVPYGPFRALDTRSNRTLLASQSVLDSSHRLIGGKTLELQLDSFVQFAYAVHFNITAVTPTNGGFMTAFGSQTSGGAPLRPNASNINFTKGVTIANHSVSPLSSGLSLFIYASATTHVIVDIQGWTLPDFSFLFSNGSGKMAGSQFRSQATQDGLGVVRRPVQRNKNRKG